VKNESPPLQRGKSWQRELSIAALAIGFGLLVLPLAIYVVGQQLLGEYRTDAGAMALAERIWLDLLSLRAPAWILVLSPYIAVQILRWVRRAWRPASL
jgi:hypothetical protein